MLDNSITGEGETADPLTNLKMFLGQLSEKVDGPDSYNAQSDHESDLNPQEKRNNIIYTVIQNVGLGLETGDNDILIHATLELLDEAETTHSPRLYGGTDEQGAHTRQKEFNYWRNQVTGGNIDLLNNRNWFDAVIDHLVAEAENQT